MWLTRLSAREKESRTYKFPWMSMTQQRNQKLAYTVLCYANGRGIRSRAGPRWCRVTFFRRLIVISNIRFSKRQFFRMLR